MTQDVDLARLLKSIGKEAFVEHYDAFANPALSNEEVAAMLPLKYTEKARRSRTSHARRVLREGRASEALEIIAESKRLDPEVVRRARVLLGGR
jgi:hypothetical protein